MQVLLHTAIAFVHFVCHPHLPTSPFRTLIPVGSDQIWEKRVQGRLWPKQALEAYKEIHTSKLPPTRTSLCCPNRYWGLRPSVLGQFLISATILLSGVGQELTFSQFNWFGRLGWSHYLPWTSMGSTRFLSSLLANTFHESEWDSCSSRKRGIRETGKMFFLLIMGVDVECYSTHFLLQNTSINLCRCLG